jgi:hypothetical protein
MDADVPDAIAAIIAECAAARTSAYARRTTALDEIKRTFKRRRDAGLKRRHAAKLARNRATEQAA